jgi:hypothetical protein
MQLLFIGMVWWTSINARRAGQDGPRHKLTAPKERPTEVENRMQQPHESRIELKEPSRSEGAPTVSEERTWRNG